MDEFFAHAVNKIRAEINSSSEAVTNGACDSIESYRHKTGRIRGLRDAIEFIKEADKELRVDDDDD